MHFYFKHLRDHPERHKFWIVPSVFTDFARKFMPSLVQYGNCARFTSEGLKRCGVTNHVSYFPYEILVDLFENTPLNNQNVVVVSCCL